MILGSYKLDCVVNESYTRVLIIIRLSICAISKSDSTVEEKSTWHVMQTFFKFFVCRTPDPLQVH